MAIPSQRDVLALVGEGWTYDAIATRLAISPGLAYLVSTGIPADGSDTYTDEELRRPGVREGSTQHLSNPPHADPTSSPVVREWLRRRAATELN